MCFPISESKVLVEDNEHTSTHTHNMYIYMLIPGCIQIVALHPTNRDPASGTVTVVCLHLTYRPTPKYHTTHQIAFHVSETRKHRQHAAAQARVRFDGAADGCRTPLGPPQDSERIVKVTEYVEHVQDSDGKCHTYVVLETEEPRPRACWDALVLVASPFSLLSVSDGRPLCRLPRGVTTSVM